MGISCHCTPRLYWTAFKEPVLGLICEEEALTLEICGSSKMEPRPTPQEPFTTGYGCSTGAD